MPGAAAAKNASTKYLVYSPAAGWSITPRKNWWGELAAPRADGALPATIYRDDNTNAPHGAIIANFFGKMPLAAPPSWFTSRHWGGIFFDQGNPMAG
jgi:hypothetical protein